MKYIHLIILTVFLVFTWSLVQSDQKVPEIINAEIQDYLKVIITEYIQKKVPNISNINFNNIWSETIDSSKLKVHFKYSFDEDNSEIGKSENLIDGFAILNKSQLNQGEATEWTLDEIQILNNHVTFEEGITLGPNDTE